MSQSHSNDAPGMRGYRLRSYDDRAEWVELETEYEGNAERLASAIASTGFQEFQLSIREVSPNRIQLKAGPSSAASRRYR